MKKLFSIAFIACGFICGKSSIIFSAKDLKKIAESMEGYSYCVFNRQYETQGEKKIYINTELTFQDNTLEDSIDMEDKESDKLFYFQYFINELQSIEDMAEELFGCDKKNSFYDFLENGRLIPWEINDMVHKLFVSFLEKNNKSKNSDNEKSLSKLLMFHTSVQRVMEVQNKNFFHRLNIVLGKSFKHSVKIINKFHEIDLSVIDIDNGKTLNGKYIALK